MYFYALLLTFECIDETENTHEGGTTGNISADFTHYQDNIPALAVFIEFADKGDAKRSVQNISQHNNRSSPFLSLSCVCSRSRACSSTTHASQRKHNTVVALL
jgi:hypothetical protein